MKPESAQRVGLSPTPGTQTSELRPQNSFAYCRRATRRAGSNFTAAFRLLPPGPRQGMHALYAFFRATDDISDEPGDPAAKTAKLTRWRAGLAAALAGVYSHRLHAALHHTVRTYGINPRHLFAVIDGVEADLEPVSFATFAELYPYCYRVASAVGLACVPVWGTTAAGYEEPAEAAGIAFQLTNILRDLGEDLARGRVYLPQDELARFGSPPESWRERGPAFRALMRFQVERAREFYTKSDPLNGMLTPAGRAIFRVMSRTYRGLLDEIEWRDFDVFTQRVRLPHWRKAAIFVGAWPVRWGLV
jgi:phytoene synthase